MTTQLTQPIRAGVRPREQAPALRLELVGGGTWDLRERRPERFTMVVFYRGHHCPVCRKQLTELARRLDEFQQRGIEVIAVSGDTRVRAQQSVDEWKLNQLTVCYGLSEPMMRDWGLFVSSAIKESEPARFNEPALMLIEPDTTVYFESIQSMPWARPQLDDVLHAIDYVHENHYPARGEG